MDDFVLCRRKYSLPVVRHYWNIRIKDFRKTTKSESTKGHNQWRKPLNFTRVRLSKISKIICQVKGERNTEREKKNYLDPEVLNSGEVGDARLQGSDFFCRWSITSRRFEASSYLHFLSVKKSTTLEDEGSTILRNAVKITSPTTNRHVPEDTILQHSVLLVWLVAYRVLVGKPEGKRPLGRPRRRWVDNIRMDLQEVGCGYMDWIGPAQDRDSWRTLVSAVMNLRVP